MDSAKDKGSRAGSRSNLNESTIPLLEDDVHQIELKEKSSTGVSSEEEKDDSKTEKHDGEGGANSATGIDDEAATNSAADEESDDKSKKKSKKKANKKEDNKVHQRQPSCVNTLSVGLNLLDRDEKHVNDHINIQFEDVISEPDSNQSFDAIWRLTFVVFSCTKLWTYRLLAGLFALPCGIFWGISFALLTCCNVWAVTPGLHILTVNLHIVKRIWSLIFRTIFDPIFQSVGLVLGSINVQRTNTA